MRSCAWLGVVALLAGCPGDPVEGQVSAGSNADASTTGDGTTMSDSLTSAMTMASQSASETTDGPLTMTTIDDTTDPTSATLEDTSSTIGETTATGDDTTTTLSAGSTETTDTGVCAEVNEPNDSEATAVGLAAIACETSMMIDATADDATAPDWFTYHGAYDEAACGGQPGDYGEPRVQVTGLPVCAFATCNGVQVTCMVGNAQNSPGGLSGCCGDGDAHLRVDCDSPDESADVFVMVDTAGVDCQPYAMTLSF